MMATWHTWPQYLIYLPVSQQTAPHMASLPTMAEHQDTMGSVASLPSTLKQHAPPRPAHPTIHPASTWQADCKATAPAPTSPLHHCPLEDPNNPDTRLLAIQQLLLDAATLGIALASLLGAMALFFGRFSGSTTPRLQSLRTERG
jgi:hypothetical protein